MPSPLILGTAQLGSAYGINNREGILNEEAAFKVLDKAWECDIRILDTAEAYGCSQQMIGKYHSAHPGRRFSICTKLSSDFELAEDSLGNAVSSRIRDDLNTLECESIYIYYLHSFEMCKNTLLMECLDSEIGKSIKHVGVSIYEPFELDYIIDSAIPGVDVVQIPFNLFNCSQWLSERLLERAVESGITLIARSVYIQGLVFFEPEDDLVLKLGLEDVIRGFVEFSESIDGEIAELACQFVRSFRSVPYVILGCETPDQVEKNASMFRSDKKLWTVDDIASQVIASSKIPPKRLDPRFWTKN